MLVPRKVGAWLNRVLPRRLLAVLHRAYGPYHQWMVGRMSRRVLPDLFSAGELRVVAGPFEGMKYLPMSGGSALLPKLLGTYEKELHPAFDKFLSTDYRAVIDIGCAEGYYVVGLALRLPRATVHGFDTAASAIARCRRLAEVNGVADRIQLHRRATIANLAPLVGPKTFIVCDCEGGELELLDPQRIPSLLQADMVVELHDRLAPRASEIIKQRFASTHRVSIIHSAERNPADFPLLASLNPKEQILALDEFRGGAMDWAVLISSGASAN